MYSYKKTVLITAILQLLLTFLMWCAAKLFQKEKIVARNAFFYAVATNT